jgi:hypothetical protein
MDRQSTWNRAPNWQMLSTAAMMASAFMNQGAGPSSGSMMGMPSSNGSFAGNRRAAGFYTDPSEKRCYHCGKPGHMAAFCPEKQLPPK